MRILTIIHEFPPLKGGASNASYHLARNLVYAGVDVHVLTAKVGDLALFEKKDGFTISRVPVSKQDYGSWSVRQLLEFTWRSRKVLAALIECVQPDILHSFFTVPNGIIAACARKSCALPHIISLRGSDVPRFDPKRFGIHHKLLKPIIKSLWSKAEQVVSVSDGLRDLAHETAPELDIAVIPNGIDVDHFCSGPDADKEQDAIKIIAVGKLIERKGYQFLIPALANIRQCRPEICITLELIGEGNFEPQLRQLVQQHALEEQVNFRGYIDSQQLPENLRTADIFTICSFSEGMSNAVLEAMACGLPIVSSNVQGARELVSEDFNGFVVPYGDVTELKQALLKLIDNPEMRQKYAINSRQRACEYQWSEVAAQYKQLYASVHTQPEIMTAS